MKIIAALALPLLFLPATRPGPARAVSAATVAVRFELEQTLWRGLFDDGNPDPQTGLTELDRAERSLAEALAAALEESFGFLAFRAAHASAEPPSATLHVALASADTTSLVRRSFFRLALEGSAEEEELEFRAPEAFTASATAAELPGEIAATFADRSRAGRDLLQATFFSRISLGTRVFVIRVGSGHGCVLPFKYEDVCAGEATLFVLKHSDGFSSTYHGLVGVSPPDASAPPLEIDAAFEECIRAREDAAALLEVPHGGGAMHRPLGDISADSAAVDVGGIYLTAFVPGKCATEDVLPADLGDLEDVE